MSFFSPPLKPPSPLVEKISFNWDFWTEFNRLFVCLFDSAGPPVDFRATCLTRAMMFLRWEPKLNYIRNGNTPPLSLIMRILSLESQPQNCTFPFPSSKFMFLTTNFDKLKCCDILVLVENFVLQFCPSIPYITVYTKDLQSSLHDIKYLLSPLWHFVSFVIQI